MRPSTPRWSRRTRSSCASTASPRDAACFPEAATRGTSRTTMTSWSAGSNMPRRGSRRTISTLGQSTRTDHASCAPSGRSVRMREKYFERREIKEAIAFAEAGGIAVHRNFDSYHGSTIRGFTREKPFLHVIGLRAQLEERGRLHGFRPEWIQPEKRRKVAHYDVFGPAAMALIARLGGAST